MRKRILLFIALLLPVSAIYSETQISIAPEQQRNISPVSAVSELDETVNIWPELQQYWTGSIRYRLGPVYGFFGTDILAGGNFIGERYRGYARFDLSDIPDGATIQGVELHICVTEVTEDENHSLIITELAFDPDDLNAADVWNSMDNWFIDEGWDVMHEWGQDFTDLNDDAVEDLQAAFDDDEDWWGVGFKEELDTRMLGVIVGYTSRSLPYCTVTYTLATPPDAPSGVVAEFQPPDTMCIEWTDNSDDETLFRIEKQYREHEEDDWGDWEEEGETGEDETSYVHEVIVDGFYRYQVRAENDDAESDWALSNQEEVVLLPSAPGEVTAEFLPPDSITVVWTDDAGNEDGYLLEVSHRPLEGNWGEWETAEDTLPENSVSAGYTTESAGDYRFRVAAVNISGSSEWMESNEVFVPPVPQAPSEFLAELQLEGLLITLSWTDNAEYEEGFRIEKRSHPGDGDWSEWSELVVTRENVIEYEDTSIDWETGYQYRIRAQNDVGESEWVDSEEVYTTDVDGNTTAAIPTETKLTGSFPNPFNSRITVTYQLHKAEPVEIRLYNLRGQIVSELVNSTGVPGFHSVSVNLDCCSSGIYFVRMTAANVSNIQKVILIR